jgi:hypothetical protein
VGVVEVRHDTLTTPIPSIDPLLYTLNSVTEVSLPIQGQTKDRTDGAEQTNMGLAKTMGGDTERPRIGSNQTLTI